MNREQAHLRSAEKYNARGDVRKAIAHFGRAIHYRGKRNEAGAEMAPSSNRGAASTKQNARSMRFGGATTCVTTPEEEEEIRSKIFGRVKKHAIVLIGGPASGKSTVKEAYLKRIGRNDEEYVTLDPDFILTSLRAYQSAQQSQSEKPNCYPVAYEINDRNLEYALKNNASIIFDGTGRDFNWTANELIERMLVKNGYIVDLCIVTLDVDIALRRALGRAERTGRHVPDSVIRQIHADVARNIPLYRGLKTPARIVVVDNSGPEPQFVYDSGGLLAIPAKKLVPHGPYTASP
jgi:predicted ABC-type ATPase